MSSSGFSPRFAVVVDLDGTLCNISARAHLARQKRWDEFHRGIPDDPPHWDVLFLLLAARARKLFEIVFCTGRPEKYRADTVNWLIRHDCVRPEETFTLLMRRPGDFRPDTVVKLEAVEHWHRETTPLVGVPATARVLAVLEDRDRVVKAWRNAGFCCWQVRPGDY